MNNNGLKIKIKKIVTLLEKEYPNVHCELDFSNPHELLSATILSAQCTDKRVNMVTPELFNAYPSPAHYAKANITDIQRIIRSTGFHKNKATNIVNCYKKIVKDFDEKIPQDMNSLISLPGVGRKTANVVLGNAFGVASGIAVDTHVKRVSMLLGLSKNSTPEKIEKDLLDIVPQNKWIAFSHLLIQHGRNICSAKKPRCKSCSLIKLCTRKH